MARNAFPMDHCWLLTLFSYILTQEGDQSFNRGFKEPVGVLYPIEASQVADVGRDTVFRRKGEARREKGYDVPLGPEGMGDFTSDPILGVEAAVHRAGR